MREYIVKVVSPKAITTNHRVVTEFGLSMIVSPDGHLLVRRDLRDYPDDPPLARCGEWAWFTVEDVESAASLVVADQRAVPA